ncbi:MAG: hypothetical protein U1G07_23915 [Verrucomicrobiota bacterium]
MRNFAEAHGCKGDLDAIAAEVGFALPSGRDMVDVIVKLRNSAAHNGIISAESLKLYNGEWLLPLISDKVKLLRAIGEAVRYLFCVLAGHTREKMAKFVPLKEHELLQLRFD